MSALLQLKQGPTSDVSTYVGPPAEVVVDNTTWTAYLQDGTTPGGHPMGGSPPAGGNHDVQYNAGGSPGGDNGLTYNPTGDGTGNPLLFIGGQAYPTGYGTIFIGNNGPDQPFVIKFNATGPTILCNDALDLHFITGGFDLNGGGAGSLGQFMASNATGASPTWVNPISKQIISATGTDSVTSTNSPKIFVVLESTVLAEALTFPAAAFDGQVIGIKFADANVAVTISGTGGDTIHDPTPNGAQGTYVEYIYDLATTTWY